MTAFTELKDGVLIADNALHLAFALEDRGFGLRVDGDRLVLSGPVETLTEADRADIKRWKSSLLVMAAYVAA